MPSPLHLVVPRRWPRPHQKSPLAPAESVRNGTQRAPASTHRTQKYSCFQWWFQTLGFSNTSFSWCHCCFSVAPVLLSVGTATVPKLTTRPSPPNRTSGARRCESARSRRNTHSTVLRFYCSTPSPWRPKPSVKSSLMLCCAAQKLCLTRQSGCEIAVRELPFSTFFSTKVARRRSRGRSGSQSPCTECEPFKKTRRTSLVTLLYICCSDKHPQHRPHSVLQKLALSQTR